MLYDFSRSESRYDDITFLGAPTVDLLTSVHSLLTACPPARYKSGRQGVGMGLGPFSSRLRGRRLTGRFTHKTGPLSRVRDPLPLVPCAEFPQYYRSCDMLLCISTTRVSFTTWIAICSSIRNVSILHFIRPLASAPRAPFHTCYDFLTTLDSSSCYCCSLPYPHSISLRLVLLPVVDVARRLVHYD